MFNLFRLDEEELKIIEALKDEDNGAYSMRVVGRGTLIMSARAVRESKKFNELLQKMQHLGKSL